MPEVDTLAMKLFPSQYHGALRAAFVELVAPALAAAREDALREAAALASGFSIRPDRRLHPDGAWEDMSFNAQHIAHTTAQAIAGEISLLIEETPPC